MITTDRSADANDILRFMEAGEELGVVVPSHLHGKLNHLATADAGKLRVALIGGFSEGKTSLAAAWLGMLPDDMKIAQGESSNAVTVYDAGDEVELIDTPGLFGFKEAIAADGTAERYKELTRKYVSEADLILYVLNPSNPLKESHREELIWLFRDLGLLPRTVFVIGRFDMVADLDDDADYDANLSIKKMGIKARLEDLIGISDVEGGNLSIVGVAANPYDEGVRAWLERPDEYARLSRVGDLRQVTARKLEAVGGAGAAKRQTYLAILRDVTDRLIMPAREAAEQAEREAAAANGKAKEEEPRLARYKREAGEAQIALRRAVIDYLGELIIEAKSTGMEDFAEFFDRKVGPNGIVVEATIRNAFTRELGPMSQQLVAMSTSFAGEISDSNAVTATLGKVAGRYGSGVSINNTMVLKARDWVMPALKFKPYGAIKLARAANGALAGIGVAVELWSMWQDAQKRQQFEKDRQAIVDDLESQRSGLLAQIDAPDFLPTYFPQIGEMQALFEAFAAAFAAASERHRRMRDWAREAEDLHVRFGGAPHRLVHVHAVPE